MLFKKKKTKKDVFKTHNDIVEKAFQQFDDLMVLYKKEHEARVEAEETVFAAIDLLRKLGYDLPTKEDIEAEIKRSDFKLL